MNPTQLSNMTGETDMIKHRLIKFELTTINNNKIKPFPRRIHIAISFEHFKL